jgi:hypothetical protein
MLRVLFPCNSRERDRDYRVNKYNFSNIKFHIFISCLFFLFYKEIGRSRESERGEFK